LRIIAFTALLVYPLTAFSMAAQSATSAALVIRHVNVIDVKNEALLKDQDVVLAGDRIVSVEPARVTRINGPSVTINGRGKYLIPGLWDCHIHLNWTTSSALPLLTALGITEVRDLGGKLADLERWRAQIADGTLVGPHIMRVGPILNGKAFNPYQFVPGSAEATRGAIRLLTYLGMDEIKVHRRLPHDWHFAALDESKKLNIRLVGHIPMEVTPEEASNAGPLPSSPTPNCPARSVPGSPQTSPTNSLPPSFVMAPG
jgi:hypothetical protein